jgi:hypothetical protein
MRDDARPLVVTKPVSKICGFMVVRKPKFASNEREKYNLTANGRSYHGVDRLLWEDLDDAYYDGRLPASLRHTRNEIEDDARDLSGLKLLKDYRKAKEVLSFCGGTSEIIAMWSPELEKIKGAYVSNIKFEYLGIDCVGFGEWSVLLYGAYQHPDRFPETVSQLNQWGLLTSDDQCALAFERYLELSRIEVVEPLQDDARATHIRVYRPLKE